MILQAYREYRPTYNDTPGIALDERQHWLVAPVGRNRDSGCLERSNWEVVTGELIKLDDGEGDGDVEVHWFGHWGVGWFEICLVRPGTPAAKCVEEWQACLSDYPVACDEHLSELEYEEACQAWEQMRLKDRVALLQRTGGNVMQARRAEFPRDDNGAILERLIRS